MNRAAKFPPPTIANLLATAIFAQTLNFKCSIATDRDRRAFEKLRKFTSLPPDWVKMYYTEVEADVMADPNGAIKNDMKTFEAGATQIGQLELYNAKSVLNKIEPFENGFVILVDIGEGVDYLLTSNPRWQKRLSNELGAKFTGSIGITDKLYLRKEIIKIMDIKR